MDAQGFLNYIEQLLMENKCLGKKVMMQQA